MEQKGNSIFFGHGLLPNENAGEPVSSGYQIHCDSILAVHSMLKPQKGLSQCHLLEFFLLLFRVPRQRVFLGYGRLLGE